jgi:hypothetical protein
MTTATTTADRWTHRNTADEIRRGAERLTGEAQAEALDRAAAEYHAAELHGFAAWCERHAARSRAAV